MCNNVLHYLRLQLGLSVQKDHFTLLLVYFVLFNRMCSKSDITSSNVVMFIGLFCHYLERINLCTNHSVVAIST